MALELLIFGVALTLVSIGNHLYFSDDTDTPTSKRIAAHTEYGLGITLLFFATPLAYTITNIGAFAIAAISLYVMIGKTVKTTNTQLHSFTRKIGR